MIMMTIVILIIISIMIIMITLIKRIIILKITIVRVIIIMMMMKVLSSYLPLPHCLKVSRPRLPCREWRTNGGK